MSTALLLCLGLALPSPPAVAPEEPLVSSLFLHPERIPLQDGRYATAERGVLVVPGVRSKPDSKPVSVEVYRFRAQASADPATPPVFELHGGPGWPGLAGVLEAPGGYEREILPRLAFSDLVVVGQRGIGSSVPNTLCEGPPEGDGLDDATLEEQNEAIREACRRCRDYWTEAGYDLSGFNVLEAAADIEDIRRHLGYEQITLWGGSFGSHWAMATMRTYPDSIARAVLTGVEGPDHTYDMPSGVLGALERIAAQAEASGTFDDQIPAGGLVEALRYVIESLEESPVELTVRNPHTRREEPFELDGEALRDAALGYSDRVNSRRGATTWPRDVLQLYRGEFERVAQAIVDQNAGGGRGLPTASFFLLDCGSGISAARREELESDPAAKIVGDLGRFYDVACPVWDVDLGEAFRSPFRSDIPTVLVHGTWDVSTPFDNALELLDHFEELQFVPVEGGTHGALGEALDFSPEFRRELDEFVVSGDMEGLPSMVALPPLNWAPLR